MTTHSNHSTATSFAHRFLPGDGLDTTLLLLHGTGGNEDSLVGLGRDLLPGANILSPRGKILEHGMPRFFRRLAEGVFDEEDLQLRTAELIAFIAEASSKYGFNPQKVVALGYSNGANTAASILLTDPSVLAGAVLLRAMVPFEPDVETILPGTPVLLLSGEYDEMIPIAGANRLAAILRDAGATLTHFVAPAGHQLLPHEFGEIREWLNDFVKVYD